MIQQTSPSVTRQQVFHDSRCHASAGSLEYQSRSAPSVGFNFEDIASSDLVLADFTHNRRSLWPSASRSIVPLRQYNFLSQVISCCDSYPIGKKLGAPQRGVSKPQPESATKPNTNMASMVTALLKSIVNNSVGKLVRSIC